VTRWKKHWLYGQKLKTDQNDSNGRIRGWFPKKCVVKVIIATNTFPNNTNDHIFNNTFVTNNKLSKKLN
jgi:hypothetical protein